MADWVKFDLFWVTYSLNFFFIVVKKIIQTHCKSYISLVTEGFSASRQIPRGQWERRLQTDIQMAKRALSEALSPEKPSCNLSASNSNPSDSSSSFSSTKPTTTQTVCYASSADNIARMLKGWMKNPPKSSRTNSSYFTSSSSLTF